MTRRSRFEGRWKARLLLRIGLQLMLLAMVTTSLWLWSRYDIFPLWILLCGFALFLTANASIAFHDRFRTPK